MAKFAEELLVESGNRACRLHNHQRGRVGSTVSAALGNPAIDHLPNRGKANGNVNHSTRRDARIRLRPSCIDRHLDTSDAILHHTRTYRRALIGLAFAKSFARFRLGYSPIRDTFVCARRLFLYVD